MTRLSNAWRSRYGQVMANDPPIVTINVSLPQPLKQYVDRRVSSGIYGSASDFVREAIREKLDRDRDRDRQDARDTLTTKLLEGLGSGNPIPFKKGHFQTKKAALIRSSGQRNSRSWNSHRAAHVPLAKVLISRSRTGGART